MLPPDDPSSDEDDRHQREEVEDLLPESVLKVLYIQGYAADVFRNDQVAQQIEDGWHLRSYGTSQALGPEPFLLDRYDVRWSLDEADLAQALRRPASEADQYNEDLGGTDKEALNWHRYRDATAPDHSVENARLGRYAPKGSYAAQETTATPANWLGGEASAESYGDGHYGPNASRPPTSSAAISYTYNQHDEQEQEEEEVQEPEGIWDAEEPEDPFDRFEPADYDELEDIEAPKSLKQYLLLLGTARTARKSPQLEVLLKVRQSTNEKFKFLYPEHALHAYYTHLKGWDIEKLDEEYVAGQAVASARAEERVRETAVSNEGTATLIARDLLGGTYFSSSEDEDEKKTNKEPSSENIPQELSAEPPEEPRELSPEEQRAAFRASVPPEMLLIMDQTALYCIKNGPAFQLRLIEREGGRAGFGFLKQNHQYHAYFQNLVDRGRAEAAAKSEKDEKVPEEAAQKSGEIDLANKPKISFKLMKKTIERALMKAKVREKEELEADESVTAALAEIEKKTKQLAEDQRNFTQTIHSVVHNMVDTIALPHEIVPCIVHDLVSSIPEMSDIRQEVAMVLCDTIDKSVEKYEHTAIIDQQIEEEEALLHIDDHVYAQSNTHKIHSSHAADVSTDTAHTGTHGKHHHKHHHKAKTHTDADASAVLEVTKASRLEKAKLLRAHFVAAATEKPKEEEPQEEPEAEDKPQADTHKPKVTSTHNSKSKLNGEKDAKKKESVKESKKASSGEKRRRSPSVSKEKPKKRSGDKRRERSVSRSPDRDRRRSRSPEKKAVRRERSRERSRERDRDRIKSDKTHKSSNTSHTHARTSSHKHRYRSHSRDRSISSSIDRQGGSRKKVEKRKMSPPPAKSKRRISVSPIRKRKDRSVSASPVRGKKRKHVSVSRSRSTSSPRPAKRRINDDKKVESKKDTSSKGTTRKQTTRKSVSRSRSRSRSPVKKRDRDRDEGRNDKNTKERKRSHSDVHTHKSDSYTHKRGESRERSRERVRDRDRDRDKGRKDDSSRGDRRR